MSTATPAALPRAAGPADRLPSALSLGVARGGLELRAFFRRRESVVFTFSLPAVTKAMETGARPAPGRPS